MNPRNKEPRAPERFVMTYVNAESVNFFVFPGKLGLGAKLGDLGVIIRPDQSDCDYAVYSDVGPARKIGEASIALADALGIPSSPKSGSTARGIIYIVFPGSGQGGHLAKRQSINTERHCSPNGGGLLREHERLFPESVFQLKTQPGEIYE